MEIFSPNFEHSLIRKIMDALDRFLKSYTRPKPRVLGLMNAKQLKDELGISTATLSKWEDNGLRRYEPPLEDTRTSFYKVSDILAFLAVEE